MQTTLKPKLAWLPLFFLLAACNAGPDERVLNSGSTAAGSEASDARSESQISGSQLANQSSPTATPVTQTDLGFSALGQKNFGKLIGAALSVDSVKDPAVAELAIKHFGSITPENELKFLYTQPQRGVFNFDQARPILEFAKKHGKKIHGHVLIWHEEYQIPDWVKAQRNNPAELEKILKEHVKGVITALNREFPNVVDGWDVVNEAISDSGGMRDSIWRRIGNGRDDYIKIAFRAAKEASPNLKLYYNDYQAEGMNQKSNEVFDLVSRLRKEGVPIDGVGLQMHRFASYWPHSHQNIFDNMERLKNLGVDIHVSELDYLIPDDRKNDPSALRDQGQFYFDIINMCMISNACKKLSVWGVTDKYSWVPYIFPGNGTALPFDVEGNAKPAAERMKEALTVAENSSEAGLSIKALNAGGSQVGRFLGDSGVVGGGVYTAYKFVSSNAVVNPAPPHVYQSHRYGNMTYSFDGLKASSTYKVRLHFAEVYNNAADQRLFNVKIQGSPVLTNFDVFKEAGGMDRAVIKEFNARSSDAGKIQLSLETVKANAMISAIEILALPTATPGPTPTSSPTATKSVNTGGAGVDRFIADSGFVGGQVYTTKAAVDTSTSTHPAPAKVYQSGRSGNLTYTFGSLSPGESYNIRLHFAETQLSGPNLRLFHVNIQNARVLTNFDVFNMAGGRDKALSQDFRTVVSATGQIQIALQGVKGNAMISGIEMIPLRTIAINAGAGAVGSFAKDSSVSGGETYMGSNIVSVASAPDSAPSQMYQSHRYGNMSYSVGNLNPSTSYNVRLHFAEIYLSGSNLRLFHVNLQGERVLNNLDVFAAAGGKDRALVQDFTVLSSSDGTIEISLQSVRDAAMISGIEIFPQLAFAVNSGGAAVGRFKADSRVTGGQVYSATGTVDRIYTANPGPAEIYLSHRYGNMTYSFRGLNSSGRYFLRLHFAEIYHSAVGQRVFDVFINQAAVWRNVDIFKFSGARGRALTQGFLAKASSVGEIQLSLQTIKDNAMISGIEVIPLD